MSIRTSLTEPYAEGATLVFRALILDVDGISPLLEANSILTSLTMTLYNQSTGAVINECLSRNILNQNNGLVGSDGSVQITLDPDDMVSVHTGKGTETHIAVIEWTWGAPAKVGRHEIQFQLKRLMGDDLVA